VDWARARGERREGERSLTRNTWREEGDGTQRRIRGRKRGGGARAWRRRANGVDEPA
jgi:hypothetical protein